MAHYRTQFFLATKTGQRTAQAAKEELYRSLERMQVAYVDLWQFHGLVDPIEWDIALSPGGAIEAAIEAKAQGIVRAIGITGHGTQVAATHRRSLERFDFDSVLLPYNYLTMQRPYYRENFNALVATCQQRNIAVQTIKSVAQRHWMGREKTTTTWYQALETQTDVDLAVHWALSRPEIFVITASDVSLAAKMFASADRFDASPVPTDEAMQQMVKRIGMEPLFV
jgi:predicted aldo/keto reductase-like oxidoreductase